MNYLVHLSTAFPDAKLLAGQYIADLLNKKEADRVSEELQKGIRMHRWLDHFSNNHSALREMNGYLYPAVGKYAPVASDVICDYLLCQCWNHFFKMDFITFVESVYNKLSINADLFPKKYAKLFYDMQESNWLMLYASYQGLGAVFCRLNARVKGRVDFTTTLPILNLNNTIFLDLFKQFYTDARNEVKNWHQ